MKTDIKDSIFKSYDIRGIYPNELNEEVALKIGRAFAEFLRKRKKLNIVVGRDGRISSRSITEKLIQGLLEGGANVIDIGLSTSPIMYFSVFYFKYDGGVQVTASHNPFQYNGFKMVREKAIPLSGKKEIKEIERIAENSDFPKRRKGKLFKKEVLNKYIKFVTNGFGIEKLRSLKIIVDTANAVPGILIPDVFKGGTLRVQSLFERIDGSFPNHNPDPLVKENLKSLSDKVKKEKVDIGVAFDGDGDRMILVDEKSNIVPADLILAFVSKIILREKKANILYDLRSSNVVRETIEKNGGKAFMSKVGHSLIKSKMRKENIIFGGEISGHYYCKKNSFCESPFFVLFTVLKEISETKKPLSKLISPFKLYYHSGEINFKVKDSKKVIDSLERDYEEGQIIHLDGLRIDFKDWWFCVRPSNTEPLLRMVLEAKTKKKMEEKVKELSLKIGEKY